MSEIEKIISFNPDQGLLYLIQQTTKQPSDEILGFFYDLGKEIIVQGAAAMKSQQRSIRKDIQDMYPGTTIPFKLLCEANRWRTTEPLARATISVIFPDNPTWMRTDHLMDMIVEKQLLGASSIPDFEPPKSRTPKMYKDLIKEVLNKNGKIV